MSQRVAGPARLSPNRFGATDGSTLLPSWQYVRAARQLNMRALEDVAALGDLESAYDRARRDHPGEPNKLNRLAQYAGWQVASGYAVDPAMLIADEQDMDATSSAVFCTGSHAFANLGLGTGSQLAFVVQLHELISGALAIFQMFFADDAAMTTNVTTAHGFPIVTFNANTVGRTSVIVDCYVPSSSPPPYVSVRLAAGSRAVASVMLTDLSVTY